MCGVDQSQTIWKLNKKWLLRWLPVCLRSTWIAGSRVDASSLQPFPFSSVWNRLCSQSGETMRVELQFLLYKWVAAIHSTGKRETREVMSDPGGSRKQTHFFKISIFCLSLSPNLVRPQAFTSRLFSDEESSGWDMTSNITNIVCLLTSKNYIGQTVHNQAFVGVQVAAWSWLSALLPLGRPG